MQRNGLAADIESVSDGIDIGRLLGDHPQDGPPRRIRYGLENISSSLHDSQVFACKYTCKYLLAQVFSGKIVDRQPNPPRRLTCMTVVSAEMSDSTHGTAADWHVPPIAFDVRRQQDVQLMFRADDSQG